MDKSHSALVNEYKGNLFEYLIASFLSFKISFSESFIDSLAPGVTRMLHQQEMYLRQTEPTLLKYLTLGSEAIAVEIIKKFNPSEVYLLGKVAGASGKKKWAEGDLLLKTESGQRLVSIKFTKPDAWLNTKSGGMKSFLSKYFPSPLSEKLQAEFNIFSDHRFEVMSRDLHEMKGIKYSESYSFWRLQGISELPGELEPELKARLKTYYHELSNKLYESLKKISLSDPNQFRKGMLLLCGFSAEDMFVAIAMLKGEELSYQFKDGMPEVDWQWEELNLDNAYFVLRSSEGELQIRIKPMNIFTQNSYKINCAVKFTAGGNDCASLT